MVNSGTVTSIRHQLSSLFSRPASAVIAVKKHLPHLHRESETWHMSEAGLTCVVKDAQHHTVWKFSLDTGKLLKNGRESAGEEFHRFKAMVDRFTTGLSHQSYAFYWISK